MHLMFRIAIKILKEKLKNKCSSLLNVPFALFHLLHLQLKTQLEKYLNTQVVIVEILKALSYDFLKWKVSFDSPYKTLQA